ncbi:hypothetical protein ScPMuIL_007325 [Solemya velum]
MSASMVLNVARFSLKNNILPGIACVRFASKKLGAQLAINVARRTPSIEAGNAMMVVLYTMERSLPNSWDLIGIQEKMYG